MIKRIFVFLLVIFLLIDSVLLIIFLRQKPLAYIKKYTFETVNPVYHYKPGQYEIFPGDLNQNAPGEVKLLGYLSSDPIIENKKAYIEVVFQTKKGSWINSKLLLGRVDEDISYSFAKNGNIRNTIQWNFGTVSAILPYLKKDYPVYLKIVYQKNLSGLSKKCDGKCLKNLEEKISLYSNNAQLLNSIDGYGQIDSKIITGPVSGVLLYVNN